MIEGEQKQMVIVGLGNPGKEYALTRHNMGYLVVQAFANAHGWTFKEERSFEAYIAKGTVEGITIHMLLPTTYMNLSGRAVKRYLEYYKIPHDKIVVVVDDIAFAFGEMRLRTMGSSGGHNGLKSIQHELETQHYVRLRIGIGMELAHKTLADHVLDTFTAEEKVELPTILNSAVAVLKRLINEPVSTVMSAVNARQKSKQEEENRKEQENTDG